jgi:hypothetical protein
MGSLQTKIQIWNMAVDHLREQPIASTSDTSAVAKWLSRNYDQQRDYLLERALWKFALDRASIAADATAPAFDWSYRYLMPTDLVRLVPPTQNGHWMGTPIAYEKDGDYLLCNMSGPLRIRYVKRITNEGLFTNSFVQLLSLRLARAMAHWLTGKASMIQSIDAMLKEAWNETREMEAFQVAGGSYYDTDIADSREAYY